MDQPRERLPKSKGTTQRQGPSIQNNNRVCRQVELKVVLEIDLVEVWMENRPAKSPEEERDEEYGRWESLYKI
jgi:hypothetical protein